MVAGRTAAVGAVADRAGVAAVRTRADGAFVVVHAVGGVVLAVHVSVVQVVDVVGVQDGLVSAAGAVGVLVGLGGTVFGGGHSDTC